MEERSGRFYRFQHKPSGGAAWHCFDVRFQQTDLWIRASRDCRDEAMEEVLSLRHGLDRYVAEHPAFLNSLVPLPEDPLAPRLARRMLRAARKAGVGPMAAVAGAIAQAVGERLKAAGACSIVENGGDCFIHLNTPVRVGVYAGPHSPFKDRLVLSLEREILPAAVCTSSRTIGHSLSLGQADAVTVLSRDGTLADACATAAGNMVRTREDVARAAEWTQSLDGLLGALIIAGDRMAAWGAFEIHPA
ncbi:MAG: UPF0280 family protein [Thermodesulfobacteriota bacterium]|nr:UPF0280 family protein [Thermodesulfobacteriota bacterium]